MAPKKLRDWISVLGYFALGVLILLLEWHLRSGVRLIQSSARMDLGKVQVGETLKWEVSLANNSSKPVEILRWSPSCHCIRVRFPEKGITPGNEVQGFLETTGQRPLGKRAVRIDIEWQYMGEREIHRDSQLYSFDCVSSISLPSQRIDLGDVISNQPKAIGSIDLRSGNTQQRWDSFDVSSQSPNLKADILNHGGGWILVAQLYTRDLPIGIWKSEIHVFPKIAGHRIGEVIEIPVQSRIVGDYKTVPSVLQLTKRNSDPIPFSFNVYSNRTPIRKASFLGNQILSPRITISNDGEKATLNGLLKNQGDQDLSCGALFIEINNDPSEELRLSFLTTGENGARYLSSDQQGSTYPIRSH